MNQLSRRRGECDATSISQSSLEEQNQGNMGIIFVDWLTHMPAMGQPVACALTQNHKLTCNIRRFFFLKLLFCDFSTTNFVHDDRVSQGWTGLGEAMVVYSLGAL